MAGSATGWMGTATPSNDRPKSAGTGAVVGSSRVGSNAQTTDVASSNNLSYGSLKNRFLSGSKPASKSSKLFSLSR